MIRKTLSSVLRRRTAGDDLWGLPYDMFDHERTTREVKAARRLERVYHKGHQRAWNGKEVLQNLLEEHGPIELPQEKREALRSLFAIVLWGELAAWKVSAELAMRLEPLEAKMAATSQAHDEARHFYVLYDYLQMLDFVPGRPHQVVTGTKTSKQYSLGVFLFPEKE